MCLSASNASVERIFSSVNLIWTDQKSRMKIETVKGILTVMLFNKPRSSGHYRLFLLYHTSLNDYFKFIILNFIIIKKIVKYNENCDFLQTNLTG